VLCLLPFLAVIQLFVLTADYSWLLTKEKSAGQRSFLIAFQLETLIYDVYQPKKTNYNKQERLFVKTCWLRTYPVTVN
jgi:hypothetical protein